MLITILNLKSSENKQKYTFNIIGLEVISVTVPLKVLSNENYKGSKIDSNDRYSPSVVVLEVLF